MKHAGAHAPGAPPSSYAYDMFEGYQRFLPMAAGKLTACGHVT